MNLNLMHVVLFLLACQAQSTAAVATPATCSTAADCLKQTLWHLPGPNPVISPWQPDGKPAWMSSLCEVAGGVSRLNATHFVFVYHCLGAQEGYQIGMSTATNILGPWTRPPLKPIVPLTAGAWDSANVACMSILRDPSRAERWLGFYAGNDGVGPPATPPIGLGIARSVSSSPLTSWEKSKRNPVIPGNRTADPKHCFLNDTRCAGIYVGSVLHGPHTNNEYWAYLAAPLNRNDEGAMSLWTSNSPEGPWKFKSYILDGGLQSGKWDSGRYSESRVLYQGGVFHLFVSASAAGGPHVLWNQTNKYVEQLGWAVSDDGVHFSEYAHNPIASSPGGSPLANGTTPMTEAMAESHAIFDEKQPNLVYVFHTIRWYTTAPTAFAPHGRNGEDLAVELFTSSSTFEIELPIITTNWDLSLQPGETSPCLYDRLAYRFCANLKTVMVASDPSAPDLKPRISFRVEAVVQSEEGVGGSTSNGCATVSVSVRAIDGFAVGPLLKTLQLKGACKDGRYVGQSDDFTADDLPAKTDFIAASVTNAAGSAAELRAVTQACVYQN